MPQSASDRADDGPRATGNSLFVSAQDGLRLHVRAHGARTNRALPVICLPGLARTTVDFDTLALALSSDRERPRRGLSLHYPSAPPTTHPPHPAHSHLLPQLSHTPPILHVPSILPQHFLTPPPR